MQPSNITTQTHHAQNRYHLRLHRARSVILTPTELVEIRAAQRTFEGAYIRTSLGQFSFALVVLKIFTSEFYSIGKSDPKQAGQTA
jgi:tmRNA-binding protein